MLKEPALKTGNSAKYLLQTDRYPDIPKSCVETLKREIRRACEVYEVSKGKRGLRHHFKNSDTKIRLMTISDLEAWYEFRQMGRVWGR